MLDAIGAACPAAPIGICASSFGRGVISRIDAASPWASATLLKRQYKNKQGP
jgi:hypothetical protein